MNGGKVMTKETKCTGVREKHAVVQTRREAQLLTAHQGLTKRSKCIRTQRIASEVMRVWLVEKKKNVEAGHGSGCFFGPFSINWILLLAREQLRKYTIVHSLPFSLS